MNRDELFLAKMEDLRRYLWPHKDEYGGLYRDYDVLNIAAILRLFLIDQFRLVDTVSRPRRFKARFRVRNSQPTSAVWWVVMDELDPDTGRNTLGHWYVSLSAIAYQATSGNSGGIEEITYTELLRRPVIVQDGNRFSVKDLIRHMAHVEGAVHALEPHQLSHHKDARASVLLARFVRESQVAVFRDTSTGEERITWTIKIPGSETEPISGPSLKGERIGEISTAVRILLVIGRIVYAGLSPLKQTIERERASPTTGS